jgi:gas vesicle protein
MRHQNMWNDSDRTFPVHIFLFGALAGSLIGAGVGLLFAPWSGVTTRRRLRRYAERALEDTVENGREALTDAMEKGREYVEDGMHKMSKAAKQAWRDTSQFAGLAR